MQAPAVATETRILTRSDVRDLLDMATCIEAVERAFRLLGEGRAPAPTVAGVHATEGGFHIKAGLLETGGRELFVAKTNANFPGNPARHGLPTIQGTVSVCDAERGTPLALMDSIEITALRTAAASAVAAKWLARDDASRLAVIGCGTQGAMHVTALGLVRTLSHVTLSDADPGRARALARQLVGTLAAEVKVAGDVGDAVREADLIVTCTTSRAFLLERGQVPAGAFVAGVGVDAEHKRELAPSLMAGATVVTDLTAQCAAFGDLHHAIAAGAMRAEGVHAELGAVVAGRVRGRRSPEEVVVFDSTGMALQDAAAAGVVYARAVAEGRGLVVDFQA